MIEELRNVLSRIPKLDIKTTLSAWGRIPTHKVNFNATKYDIVEQILELAMNLHVTQDEAFQLELLYVTEYPEKKLWKAYHLVDSTGVSLDEAFFQPSSFQRCLSQRVYVTHACNVQVRKHQFALWGRVGRGGSSQVLYFICFPFSRYFLLNKSSNNVLANITIRALKRVLGYTRCDSVELESHSPSSLAQILLHRRSSDSEYTYDDGFYKALERNESEQIRDFCDERVQIQHMEQLKKEKRIIDRQYGKLLQPQLQSLIISTSTEFRGRSHLPSVPPSTIINCRTKIVGSNVLEGLRNAALQNLCYTPLPTFLTSVADSGIQCIRLTDKRRNENLPP